MSTRSTTHFYYEGDKKPTAIIYRHSDGYPEGAGVDLHCFLNECGELQNSCFSDPSYLASKYVVFLASMFNLDYNDLPKPQKLDFISVGVLMEDPGDIAYRYVVTCADRKRPSVKCYKVNAWNADERKPLPMKRWELTEVPIPEPKPEEPHSDPWQRDEQGRWYLPEVSQ